MSISRKDVEHLATLARLGLSEDEKKKFEKDLERILAYVGELSKAYTGDVLPMTGGTELMNVVRRDEERVDSYEAKDYLFEQVPHKEGRHVKVPRILE
ncbi:MAG: Asp-tRNA(Asn)/Glu-tRNA(Gln) amidotransferase subunit GatC [Parcubacteria group bacterium]|nr:Asp-tRNA(Asn)/Glu-tRNA(Gln) amidotransferase subunit GatC [Parcubacteria group bacterium]